MQFKKFLNYDTLEKYKNMSFIKEFIKKNKFLTFYEVD